jgi:hypothetical protein
MARKRRRRRAKPGSLEQLTAVLWGIIIEYEALMNEEDCPSERALRCAHALAQLSSAYRGVVEVAQLDERIAALEAAMQGKGDRR